MKKCKTNPVQFCYICGKFTFPDRQAIITQFVKKSVTMPILE